MHACIDCGKDCRCDGLDERDATPVNCSHCDPVADAICACGALDPADCDCEGYDDDPGQYQNGPYHGTEF